VRTYRALVHLYPRRFRREYGDDMVLLLEQQLRDEPAVRVVARVVLDLVVSIPTRHLEVVMNRSAPVALVVAAVATAVALAVFGSPIGITGAVLLLAFAALVWRRNRPVAEEAHDARWWKLLLAGGGMLGALVVVTTITGELPSGGWYVAMVVLLASLGLIAAGVLLGLATLARPASRA
jgi:uncharacterized membrane protein YdcZ (DUF606 family)